MDLNMMMRETARNSLQTALDAAVTNGDTEAARKVAADIAALEVSTAPKPQAYTPDDIKAEMKKLDWFGVDPKKSAKAMELGKHMDLSKFPSATAFAAAVAKAVEEEFNPKPAAGAGEGEDEEEEEDDDKGKGEPKTKKTDGPGEGDNTQRTTKRTSSGPWTKLADAPADVQKEIRRSADKFVPAKADAKQRESFIAKALESQYAMFQRNKGKK